jgi:uncharacterized protein (DUF433 family)
MTSLFATPPVFKGTRVPFKNLLAYLEGGQTRDEFLADFPTVTREAEVRALELKVGGVADRARDLSRP